MCRLDGNMLSYFASIKPPSYLDNWLDFEFLLNFLVVAVPPWFLAYCFFFTLKGINVVHAANENSKVNDTLNKIMLDILFYTCILNEI